MVRQGPKLVRSAARFALIGLGAVSIALLSDVRIVPGDPAFGMAVASHGWLVAAHLAAGLALLGAGILALASGILLPLGVLATLAGLAWLGQDLAGRALGVPVVGAMGAASSLLVVPLLFHLATVVSRAGGTTRGQGWRLVIVAAYGAVAVVAVARLVTYAPFHELGCTSEDCSSMASILDVDRQGRAGVRLAMAATSLALGIALSAVAALGMVRHARTSLGRAVLLGGGILAGLALAVGAALELGRRFAGVGLQRSAFEPPVIAAWSLGVIGIGVGLVLLWWRASSARRRIRLIADGVEAAPAPGSLAPALAAAVADPGLRLGYRTDPDGPGARDAYVDADGAPFDPDPGQGRVRTPVTRDGSPIAVIIHRDDVDQQLLKTELPLSMVVALDNERLRAVRLAQVRALRSSRARIVEVGDAERRRIERDLHDGAQQRLLAIAFDLRLARTAAEREDRSDAVTALAAAEALALDAVDELRRLCRGIHPQVLSQAGLGPALTALADTAAVPLEVHVPEMARAPAGVETAAYEVVVEALGQADRRGSTALAAEVVRDGEMLRVTASDDRPVPLGIPTRLSDRVGAAGGELRAWTSDGRAFLRADLPCA